MKLGKFNGTCALRQLTSRCTTMDFFYPQHTNWTWIPPVPLLEGPEGFGKDNPRCSDMNTGMVSQCIGKRGMMKPSGTVVKEGESKEGPISKDDSTLIEEPRAYTRFFPIEFARDVIFQTPEFKTSQEMVANYMKEHPAERCVVNVGLHDMALDLVVPKSFG